jgi:hypothetical protein
VSSTGDAGRARGAGRALAQARRQGRVERGAEPDLVRDHRGVEEVVVAVDGVGAVDDRDAEATVIQGELLDRVDLVGPGLAVVAHGRPGAAAGEDRADVVDVEDVVEQVGVQRAAVPGCVRRALEHLDVDLAHLADLLVEVHAAEEVADPLVDGQRGIEVGSRRLRSRRWRGRTGGA